MRIAACETIAVYNTGAGSKAVTMELWHVTPEVNTMKALRQQDESRVLLEVKICYCFVFIACKSCSLCGMCLWLPWKPIYISLQQC